MERLQNILVHAGIASRRKSAEIIAEGRVSVDGIIVKEPGVKFDPSAVKIKVDGRELQIVESKRTVVLYKPTGVLSSMSDPFGERTVAELVDVSERLVPVGRLDKDSEGLLLMSNDGDLVNKLTHPRYEHRKVYLVKVAGRWNEDKLALLRSPITLDDGYTIRPVPVEVVREWENNTRLLKFTLSEGRKRQIRKMCSAAHLVVLSLKRVAVGGFSLPKELALGQWRDLTAEEISSLWK